MAKAFAEKVKRHWTDDVKKAEHYLALGQTELWLGSYDGYEEWPWEFVTRVEPGGSHRLEISTSVSFYAKHPSGLTFRWSYDIESRDANGSGSYMIDVAGIRSVMHRMPDVAKASMRQYLKECVAAVSKKADEWQAVADGQYNTARQLEKASEL